MDVDSNYLNESALKLALEIMYLLTGEVYLIIKKLGDRTSVPHVSEGLIQHALTLPSPYSEESENSDQKILDLTKTIIALLTREVPIRCQDVTVYFSMEEWEYIDEHKDEYKDLLMENRHSLTSLGGSSRRSPEPQTHPGICHYNPETRTEKPNGSQVMVTDGLTKRIKVETEDDRYRRNYPDRCKEEVVPVAFYPEASSNRNTSPGSSASPHLSYKTEADFTQRSSPESIYEDLLTFTERRRMNERILELTMEIIDLLSKGDYLILKSSGEHVIPNNSVHRSAGRSSTQSSLTLPASNSFTFELHNDQKILQVINKLNELLTGEVPMRCQDITVYFSVEEWEFFEQHKDLYVKRAPSPSYRTSQGFIRRDVAPIRRPLLNIPPGDADFSDSEETVSDSEDYDDDDDSQSDSESEEEIPLSKINDPDLHILLNRLRKMVKESEDYNPQCFQNDPEWGPGC